jgi:quercetin dioxygenase-like cupin family protein
MPTTPISTPCRQKKFPCTSIPVSNFIYVLKGKLSLKIAADQEILEAGDSRYFASRRAHGYSRAGSKPCRAMVITAE